MITGTGLREHPVFVHRTLSLNFMFLSMTVTYVMSASSLMETFIHRACIKRTAREESKLWNTEKA
jgi:hypothetical protein